MVAKPAWQIAKWAARLTQNTELAPEGEITVKQRDDGVDEVMVPQNRSPNDVWASKMKHFEYRSDGKVVLHKEVISGGNLPGRVQETIINQEVSPPDLSEMTDGMVEVIDGRVEVNPTVRDAMEALLHGGTIECMAEPSRNEVSWYPFEPRAVIPASRSCRRSRFPLA